MQDHNSILTKMANSRLLGNCFDNISVTWNSPISFASRQSIIFLFSKAIWKKSWMLRAYPVDEQLISLFKFKNWIFLTFVASFPKRCHFSRSLFSTYRRYSSFSVMIPAFFYGIFQWPYGLQYSDNFLYTCSRGPSGYKKFWTHTFIQFQDIFSVKKSIQRRLILHFTINFDHRMFQLIK